VRLSLYSNICRDWKSKKRKDKMCRSPHQSIKSSFGHVTDENGKASLRRPWSRCHMDYQPVIPGKHAKPAPEKHSVESRYWRSFKNPVFVKEYAPVTSIHFTLAKPHRYAVTAATRVHIYAPRTQKIIKTISRFKDVARSGLIRDDGKLLVAGDDSGLIQVSRWSWPYLPSLPHSHALDL